MEQYFYPQDMRKVATLSRSVGYNLWAMTAEQPERTARWIASLRWIQIILLVSVAVWWALWDFDRGAVVARLTRRLGWTDPALFRTILFWAVPIGGVALVQL